MSTLLFDADKHLFTWGGHRVPSTTQILKEEGWIDTRWYNAAALERGSDFHQASAMLDAGRLDWRSVSEEVTPYLLSYEKAKADLHVGIAGIERIVHKGQQWAGILDRVWKWKGSLVPAEYKTGGPEGWHKLQLASYAATWRRRPRYGVLLYVGRSSYKLVELSTEELDPLYMLWYHTMSVFYGRRALS
jgi:hypothetical protein